MDNAKLLESLHIGLEERQSEIRNRTLWPWLLGIALLFSIAILAWWRLSGALLSVATTVAIPASSLNSSDPILQATGYVTARRQATVSAQITGTVTEVLIEEGDHFKKGQVMARLDDSAYKAALDAARAQASAARALIAQYQVQLSQNLRDLDRDEAIAEKKLISVQTVEQARTLAASTKAQLASQRAQVAADDAQVVEAQVNYDYCVVRAPFDGVITTKDAQIGEIISPLSAGGGFTRTGIGTIVDMDSLEIDVDVNEAYIGRVQPGMKAEAVLDAYPDWKILAYVIAIVPAADRGKATVSVRIGIRQKDIRIVPDMGARVSFLGIESTKADQMGVAVPSSSVVKRGKDDVVFVVANGKVLQRTVNAGSSTTGNLRLIPSNLVSGDVVVTAPPPSLTNGARVAVAQTTP